MTDTIKANMLTKIAVGDSETIDIHKSSDGLFTALFIVGWHISRLQLPVRYEIPLDDMEIDEYTTHSMVCEYVEKWLLANGRYK